MVGALDLFGDTARLVHGFGLGIWHLIAMPAEGAARGSVIQFVFGFFKGVYSMVRGKSNAMFSVYFV